MTKAQLLAVGSTAELERRPFPVLRPPSGCPMFVKWAALDDGWAQRVHGQTLEHLAKRGGLNPVEIAMNLMRVNWANGDAIPQDAAVAMMRDIAF